MPGAMHASNRWQKASRLPFRLDARADVRTAAPQHAALRSSLAWVAEKMKSSSRAACSSSASSRCSMRASSSATSPASIPLSCERCFENAVTPPDACVASSCGTAAAMLGLHHCGCHRQTEQPPPHTAAAAEVAEQC